MITKLYNNSAQATVYFILISVTLWGILKQKYYTYPLFIHTRDRTLSQVVNDELLGQMKDQFEVLEEFFGHKIDENLIQHLRTHH